MSKQRKKAINAKMELQNRRLFIGIASLYYFMHVFWFGQLVPMVNPRVLSFVSVSLASL